MVQFRDDGLFDDDEFTAIDYAADAVAGVWRGAEGFLQAGYSLLDAATFDSLPDWERQLRKSRTWAGGITEMITQIGLGWAAAPVAVGVLGSSLLGISKIPGLLAVAKGAAGVKKAATLLQGSGLVANVARGAVADFTFLQSQDSVLVSLGLELGFDGELNDFLTSEGEDLGFLEGRLRNALEGAALGAAIEGIIRSAKVMNAFRQGKKLGNEQALKAAEKVARKMAKETTEDVKGVKKETKLTFDGVEITQDAEKSLAAQAAEKVSQRTKEKLVFHNKAQSSKEFSEKAADDLMTRYGKQLPRRRERADLAQSDGPEISNVGALAEMWSKGQMNLDAMIEDGTAHEVLALLKVAMHADRDLPGLTYLVGREAETWEDFIQAAAPKVAETMDKSLPDGAAFLDQMLIHNADDVRAARSSFLAAEVYKEGAREHYARVFSEMVQKGDISGAEDLLLDAVLNINRVIVSGHALMSEAGSLLNAGKFVKSADERFLQMATAIRTRSEKVVRQSTSDKESLAIMKEWVAASKHLGKGKGDVAVGLLANMSRGKGRAMTWLEEGLINNLLAGVRTLTVTGIGGTTMLFMRPAERFLGQLANGEFVQAHRQWRRYWQGVTRSMREAGAIAYASFGSGVNIQNPRGYSMFGANVQTTQVVDGVEIVTSAISPSAKGVRATIIRGFGKRLAQYVTFPRRAITGIDQFFRQVGSRAEMSVQLEALAVKKGIVDEIAIDEFVTAKLHTIVGKGRQLTKAKLIEDYTAEQVKNGVNPIVAKDQAQDVAAEFAKARDIDGVSGRELLGISKRGLRAGDKIAFTETFDRNGLAGMGQRILGKLGIVGKIIVPFYSTPLQILGAAFERSVTSIPVAAKGLLTNPKPKAFIKSLKDPRTQEEAYGQAIIAISSIGLIWDMTNQGIITGRGPSDFGQKTALEATGWRPYSIKSPDGTYWSYARLDPVASMFGLYADMKEQFDMYDPGQDDMIDAFVKGTVATFQGNFMEKSYMKGLHELQLALQTGEGFSRYMGEAGANILGPGIARNISDWMREDVVQVHGFLDGMNKRWSFMPGIDDPEPMRNILGEKVDSRRYMGMGLLPIEYAESSSDIISGEMASIQYSIRPAPRTRNGNNLKDFRNEAGQSAYDRWMELKGQVKVGGRTLTSNLSRTIRSRRYRSLPDVEDPRLTEFDLGSPKVQEIRTILSRFQEKAWLEMLKEFPDLRLLEEKRARTQSLARQGRLR